MQNTEKCAGILSNVDIKREILEKNLCVFPEPYNDKDELTGLVQIKSASLDITPSCLIMSVNTGCLLKIYEEKISLTNPEAETRYVYIEPRDTVLVISREYLIIPANICGSVNSRVSTVSAGLGHISTTIDPGWNGALLIAVSNPSSVRKRLDIQKEYTLDCPLATITFHYLATPAELCDSNPKPPARVDILKRYTLPKDNWTKWDHLKKVYSTVSHFKDHKLTTSVITELNESILPEEWPKKLQQLENAVLKEKIAIVRWKTDMLKWSRVLLNLLMSILSFIIVFSVIYVISTPNNEITIFQIIWGIVHGRIPPNTNLSLISGVVAMVTFIRGLIRDAQKD